MGVGLSFNPLLEIHRRVDSACADRDIRVSFNPLLEIRKINVVTCYFVNKTNPSILFLRFSGDTEVT